MGNSCRDSEGQGGRTAGVGHSLPLATGISASFLSLNPSGWWLNRCHPALVKQTPHNEWHTGQGDGGRGGVRTEAPSSVCSPIALPATVPPASPAPGSIPPSCTLPGSV